MRVRRRRAAAAPRPPPARCLAASRALFPGPPARLEPGFRRERVPRQAKSRLPADRGGAQGFLGGGREGTSMRRRNARLRITIPTPGRYPLLIRERIKNRFFSDKK